MKKVLLGTTALVAAGFVVGEAQAADPVALSIGGYYATAYGGNFSESDRSGDGGANNQEHGLLQDVEVHFKGETTLDNGLTVGVRIELEGQEQAGDQVDETWAYISGSWGQLRVGDEDNVAANMAVSAPYAGVFSATSPWFSFFNAGDQTNNAWASDSNYNALNEFGDASKLYYNSPAFNGFSFGISYAPDGSQDTRSPGLNADNTNNGLQDIGSVAVAYSGEIAGISVGASLGYIQSRTETEGVNNSQQDPNAWHTGLSLGYGNWKVGGTYSAHDTDDHTFNFDVWDVGVTYGVSAWSVGLGYSEVAVSTAFNVEDDENSVLTLGVGYALGGGVTLGAALSNNNFNNNSAGGNGADYNATAAMMGMIISY